MAFKTVGEETTTSLTIQFTTEAGAEYLINADATPTLTITLEGDPFSTVTDATNDSTGEYSAAWTPTSGGEYLLTWSFVVEGTSYETTETIFALTDASTSATETSADPSTVCALTATFVDAGGLALEGVYVRFSVGTTASALSSIGFVAGDATAVSDESGEVSLSVVRGATGLLTVSDVGIVRRVTIPDATTKDLFDMLAEGEDLLEVQELELVDIPRRS